MSASVAPNSLPPRRSPYRGNSIAFPRGLRDAISPQHDARVLEIDSVSVRPSRLPWAGPAIEMKLVASETGKLTGKFAIRLDLQPDAARRMAALLCECADKAEQRPGPGEAPGS
jgi:hypothetical protein